jgi:hypothetical protein
LLRGAGGKPAESAKNFVQVPVPPEKALTGWHAVMVAYRYSVGEFVFRVVEKVDGAMAAGAGHFENFLKFQNKI